MLSHSANLKIIQIGELIVDSKLSLQTISTTYKGASIPYTEGHGAYYPERSRYYRNPQSLDMEVAFPLKEVPSFLVCKYREYIQSSLEGVVRVWAMSCGKLVWQWARVQDITDTFSFSDTAVTLSPRIELLDGVWKCPDPKKIFLEDYYACGFDDSIFDCKSCDDERCPSSELDTVIEKPCGHCEDGGYCCSRTTGLDSLCDATKGKRDCDFVFGDRCKSPKRIVYSCVEAEKRSSKAETYGVEFDSAGATAAGGKFNSSTVIDSDQVIVRLVGCFENPQVAVNGSTVSIEGSHSGTIVINGQTGDIDFSNSLATDLAVSQSLVSLSKVSTSPYFMVKPCDNVINVTGICENSDSKIYIDHERLM